MVWKTPWGAGMDGRDIALLAVSGYLAVMSLVRLMLGHRDRLHAQLVQQHQEEVRRRKKLERKKARLEQERQRLAARRGAA